MERVPLRSLNRKVARAEVTVAFLPRANALGLDYFAPSGRRLRGKIGNLKPYTDSTEDTEGELTSAEEHRGSPSAKGHRIQLGISN